MLGVAILLNHVDDMLVYRRSAALLQDDRRLRLAEDIVRIEHAITATPPSERATIAHALSGPDMLTVWTQHPLVTDRSAELPPLQQLRQTLATLDPPLAERDMRLDAQDAARGERRADLLAAIALPDGSWLGLSVPRALDVLRPPLDVLLSTSIIASSIVMATALLVAMIGAPLRALVRAADAIGQGPLLPIAETGSEEIRRVARAMNAMQARISRLLDDRTEALAAVSHDLRTPIARLRLRTASLDSTLRQPIEADLAEMDAMVGAVLAYLRGDDDPEPARKVDLVALVATLLEEAEDAGHKVSYAGPPHTALKLRRLAIKRAFANLIGNALAYGGNARVCLHAGPDATRVVIDDDGPGIPEAELDRVFEAFHRLEPSRNRNTGGIGLGLAIARRAIVREGGTITLSNRPEGGLRAEVTLPRASAG